METNRISGLIYKVQSYKETSKLVYVYSNIGKISFISSGSLSIKSPNRIITQYLTLLEFDLPKNKNKLNKLINAKIINSYDDIKKDYYLTKRAGALLELINDCVYEDEKHHKIFEQLMIALDNINSNTSYIIFSLRLLMILGYHFDFKREKGIPRGYSISQNKVVFNKDEYVDLNFEDTKLMLDLILLENDKTLEPTNEQIINLNSFVKNYYNFHLQINLKLI